MASSHLDRAGGFIRQNGLWLTAALVVALFAGIAVLSDLDEVARSIAAVDPAVVLLVLGLVTTSYGVRFLKWEYYLRELDIDATTKGSLVTFLSGLMLTVTPVKLGEAWKAWFLQNLEGPPADRTMAVVGAERVTDLIALTVMAALVVFQYEAAIPVLAVVTAIGLLVLGVLHWRAGSLALIRAAKGVPVLGSYVDAIRRFYEDSYALFRPKPFAISMVLSLVAWGIEGFCLWLVLLDLGANVDPITGISVFGLGSVVGAASLLPGGLAAAEASMAGVIVALGQPRHVAIAATLVIRAATLWYGVLLGTLVFSLHKLRSGE